MKRIPWLSTAPTSLEPNALARRSRALLHAPLGRTLSTALALAALGGATGASLAAQIVQTQIEATIGGDEACTDERHLWSNTPVAASATCRGMHAEGTTSIGALAGYTEVTGGYEDARVQGQYVDGLTLLGGPAPTSFSFYVRGPTTAQALRAARPEARPTGSGAVIALSTARSDHPMARRRNTSSPSARPRGQRPRARRCCGPGAPPLLRQIQRRLKL